MANNKIRPEHQYLADEHNFQVNDDVFKDYVPANGRFNCAGKYIWEEPTIEKPQWPGLKVETVYVDESSIVDNNNDPAHTEFLGHELKSK